MRTSEAREVVTRERKSKQAGQKSWSWLPRVFGDPQGSTSGNLACKDTRSLSNLVALPIWELERQISDERHEIE